MRRVTIGLLGCGTVGQGFVELLAHERERIRGVAGVDLQIGKILVRDAGRKRPGVDRGLVTDKATEVLDGDCDLIVELVGGVTCAGAYVRRALARGRSVVTANKALLARDGADLFAMARRSGAHIGFEASVCGGIPIVRALRHGLAGDSIESITGILNGTTNYILTRMEEDNLGFDDALRLAQARGFAEADPSLDVDGHDAAQKLRILAELAFGPRIHVKSRVAGIRDVSRAEVEGAASRGAVIRHVASVRGVAGGVELRVERRELPSHHPLAAVKDENNAVVVRGRAVGEMTFSGRGAGSMPTAAAVLSDVIELGAEQWATSYST
jgi:homoserine dehydrogenase